MKLSKNQIKKMLELFFCEDDDMYKCFDTRNVEWISDQDIELSDESVFMGGQLRKTSWKEVWMNGSKITTINSSTYEDDYEKVLAAK